MILLPESSCDLTNLKVEPRKVIVRSSCNLTLSFSLSLALPMNSFLIFRFRGGRNNKNDWYFLQADDPRFRGHVKLVLNERKRLLPLLITGKELLVKFIILDESGLKSGASFQFKVTNTLVQSLAEKSKKIEIFACLPGKKPKLLEPCPVVDVVSEQFDHLTIIAPSLVSTEKAFRVVLRAEDRYKNLAKNFIVDVQLYRKSESNGKEFISDIKFEKENLGVFVMSDLKLQEPGIYRIEGSYKEQCYESNPIVCKNGPMERTLYWGYIHGHTTKSDGMLPIEEYFENMLQAGLDFGTSTEHDHAWETSDDDFEDVRRIVNEYDSRKDFVSLFGYEYGSWYSGFGDICIYHEDDSLPIFRSDTNKYNSTPKLIKNLRAFKGKVLMIAHHTALRPGFRNWDYFDNDLERLVEIYSTWGNQEYSFLEGNPLPTRYKFFGRGPHAKKRGAILEKRNCLVQDALKRGYKLGFTAGGDDHFGAYPSGMMDPDNGIYPSGIMAVWSDNLTRQSIWKALMDRKCYGTTGPRVIVEFYLEDFFMGDIIDLKDNLGLKSKRTLKSRLVSPINIEKIELIRNNIVIKKEIIKSTGISLDFVDDDDFCAVALAHSVNKNERFIFYYIRIFLEDDNMAWSSPIWLIRNQD